MGAVAAEADASTRPSRPTITTATFWAPELPSGICEDDPIVLAKPSLKPILLKVNPSVQMFVQTARLCWSGGFCSR